MEYIGLPAVSCLKLKTGHDPKKAIGLGLVYNNWSGS
jgi:hypothetical protein